MDATPTNPTSNRRDGKTPAKTPNRRPISTEAPSSRRSVHTPLDRSASRDLLNSVRRGASASGGRKNNAPTPHARAARRALDQRRTAMFTPGRNRRRSLMEKRETPMGILRNLGKVLAPASQAIVSSSPRGRPSSIAPIQEEYEDDEDELTIDRPRLSLPIDEEDESDLLPPRSAGLEDENYTVRSVELPRRAEQQASRLSRGSLGSVRVSDFFGNNDPDEITGRQSDFFPGLLEDLQAQAGADDDFTYQRIDDDPTRRTLGRESDFGLQMPEGLGDQTTFLLSEPPADGAPTSPLVEQSVTEALAPNEQESELNVDDFGDGFDLDMAIGQPDEAEGEDGNATVLQQLGLKRGPKSKKLRKRISRHGVEYPPLPPAFVKRVAQTALQTSGLSNSRISADTLTALTQASDWFFEQLGDDLGAYASHAKRKTIEESDVVTLMRRQRQVGSTATMFSLAQKHLPRELLQELRMPVPQPAKVRRAKRTKEDAMDVSEVT